MSSCGSKTVKEFNKVTKIDAVKMFNEGYHCDKISIEKLKHLFQRGV